MHVIWNKHIQSNNLWEPEFFGVFYELDGNVMYCFKDRSNLMTLSENSHEPKLVESFCIEEKLTMPRKWMVIDDKDDLFLLFSKERGINLTNGMLSNKIPDHIQHSYINQIHQEEYYVEASFSFGEYTIMHKGKCGYVCKKDGYPIWGFIGQGYLYTDITHWDGHIAFGTAGSGGFFYVIDIANGEVLNAIQTGGTRNFVRIAHYCYLLDNSTPSQLLCIDLTDGTIISQCQLVGKNTLNSRISLIKNRIHTITFDHSKNKQGSVIWNCVEI